MCQYPQRASTYFFNTNVTMEQILNAVCQCPQRASTYFFKLKSRREAQKEVCVNALNGLLLISSTTMKNAIATVKSCQCPQRASTYFFLKISICITGRSICVNALNGLLLISSRDLNYLSKKLEDRVNALNGLLLISSRCTISTPELVLCINALNGLLLISSWRTRSSNSSGGRVSMPSTGFYLFLLQMNIRR